jgi:hypothetical protein
MVSSNNILEGSELISWEDGAEGANEYNLYQAIMYWSDKDDYTQLRQYYINIQEFKEPANRNFNFLPLENTKDKNAVLYNLELKNILKKFIGHLEAGCIEIWGLDSKRQKTKLELFEIKACLTSHKFDFLKSEIPHIGVTGITVYKVSAILQKEGDTRWSAIKNLILAKVTAIKKSSNNQENKIFLHNKNTNKAKKGDINKTAVLRYIFESLPGDLKKDLKVFDSFKKSCERNIGISVWE